MKTIILKNSEWLRGKPDSYLYDSGRADESKPCMCCLGVLSYSEGFKLDELSNRRSPVSLISQWFRDHKRMPRSKKFSALSFLLQNDSTVDSNYCFEDTKDAEVMMNINDDLKSRDTTKVRRLNKIMNKYGYNFVFLKDK
jgi:hypothetical protein